MLMMVTFFGGCGGGAAVCGGGVLWWGDFNLVLEKTLDCSNQDRRTPIHAMKALRDIMALQSLVDVCRQSTLVSPG